MKNVKRHIILVEIESLCGNPLKMLCDLVGKEKGVLMCYPQWFIMD
jgi:hypothetical protein